MICNLIGVTLMCIHTGSGITTIYDRNAAEPPRQVHVDPDPVYRSLGMKTNYEYFCRGKIHPMDQEMCGRK